MNNQEGLSTLISALKQRDGGKFREDVGDSMKIIGREVGAIREVSRMFRHYRDQYPDTYKDFCDDTKDAIEYVAEESRNIGVTWYLALWDCFAKPEVIKDLERWLKDKGQPKEKGGQSKTNITDYKALNLAEVPISKLMQQSESHTLEFKEIPECNTQQNRKNNDVLFPPLKTIAGFLNAEGGILLIGVDNSGKIVGIEPYLNTMGQGNNDTFEQQIRNCLRDRFEPYPIGKVKVSFEKFMKGTVCRIDVQADKEPVNLDNEIYVRDGNTTQLLKGRRLTDWIQQRRLLTELPSGK